MTTTKDSLMATTHADAAEMPDTLDPDVVGVWVWFPGDDLAGDPAADAWDLYSREGYELGFGGGGCAGADPHASVTDLLEVSIRNLDLSDAAGGGSCRADACGDSSWRFARRPFCSDSPGAGSARSCGP